MAPRREAIVVGGSAGALEALYVLLGALSPELPAPLVVVMHLAPTGPNRLPGLLAAHTALRVKEAEDKEPLENGVVYLAPPDYHLFVERGRTLALSVDPPVRFSRPSIDVLFESAADTFGEGLVGVLLSGANDDGARGFAAIKARGGATVVQEPATAVVPTMPAAALSRGVADLVAPLHELGPLLRSLLTDDALAPRTTTP